MRATPPYWFVIVGSAGFGRASNIAGATPAIFDLETAQTVMDRAGLYDSIDVRAEPGVTVDALQSRVSEALPPGYEAVTTDQLTQESDDAISEGLGFFKTFLLVFAFIALFVGAFIISNTFAMSVRERMREFALLRAIGASPTQVFTSVLVQATIVGLIGAGLGILGGFGLVEAMRGLLESMGMDLAGDLPVDAFTIVVSLLVGTVVSVAAAALPARRAALVPPVEAMRDDVAATDGSLSGTRPRRWTMTASRISCSRRTCSHRSCIMSSAISSYAS